MQPRDVDQDAARDDAVLQILDAELRAALLGVDVGARVAVVGLLLVEDVAQRVDVAVRVAVIRDAVGVGGEAAVHRVLERARVVGRGFGERIVRQRDGDAVLGERERLPPLRLGDQVRRAELIVGSPASPVLHLVEHLIELLGVARKARRRCTGTEQRRRGSAPRCWPARPAVKTRNESAVSIVSYCRSFEPPFGRLALTSCTRKVISFARMSASALSVAFFFSGAAGLIFQVVWFYRAGLVFGSSLWAVTIVLSSFMGGLALGNALAGRYASRVGRSLVPTLVSRPSSQSLDSPSPSCFRTSR